MSANIIKSANVVGEWDPATFTGHHVVLAPIFALHAAAGIRRSNGTRGAAFRWEWDSVARTLEALEVIWNMTGRWNARRAVTIRPAPFRKRVLEEVPQVAKALNRAGVACLRDIVELEPRDYNRVTGRIHSAVHRISALRRTKQTEPVLGSKVLHHYFPSVVPVFDTRFIRNSVMRSDPYRSSFDSWKSWLIHEAPAGAGGQSMLDFHRYSTFCAWQIGTASKTALEAARTRFAKAMAHVAPGMMAKDRDSLLWRLDAKIAEYCAVNAVGS